MHILDGGGEGGGCGALEAAADEGKLADSRFRRRECRDERDCTKVAKVALLQKDAGDVPGSGGGSSHPSRCIGLFCLVSKIAIFATLVMYVMHPESGISIRK